MYIYGIETRSFKVLIFTLKICHPLCTHLSFETIRAGMQTSVKGDKHLDYWTIKSIRAKVNCYRRLQKSSTFVIVANSCCIYRCNRHWSLTTYIDFTNTVMQCNLMICTQIDRICTFHQGSWYKSGSTYLRILVCGSTKVSAFIDWQTVQWRLLISNSCPCVWCVSLVWSGHWLQLAAHVWLLMSNTFSNPLCISLWSIEFLNTCFMYRSERYCMTT